VSDALVSVPTRRRAAIIGAGSIGIAWAVVFARAGWTAAVFDVDPGMLDAVSGQIASRLAELAAAGLLADDPVNVAHHVEVSGSIDDAVTGCEWVQECVVESLPVKRDTFGELDALAAPSTILASSTSMIACSRWAAELPGRSRCLVVHPGNPPYLLPIAEVVPAPFTDAEVVERAMAVQTAIGMTPILVRGEPEGFVFNRLQGALLREAYCLVRDGVVDAADLDRVVSHGLGRRWSVIGPFATSQLNTRGGIRRHAEVMGPAYERMGSERGQHDPWTPELVERVASAVERSLPADDWAQQVLRRDAALIALERARQADAELFTSFERQPFSE
jgi:L-gulonate 3-dehydrogenase